MRLKILKLWKINTINAKWLIVTESCLQLLRLALMIANDQGILSENKQKRESVFLTNYKFLQIEETIQNWQIID